MATMEIDHAVPTLPPHANLIEGPTNYVIELDVSDFAHAELDVSLHGRFLTVVGEHETPANDQPFSVHERLEETFSLPEDVHGDGVEAILEGGTLEIRIPRRAPVHGERHVPIHRRSKGAINPDATPC
jgi:HSP20 family molecular chaperone IbpA